MAHRRLFGCWLLLVSGFLAWTQPIGATEAVAIDPTKECLTPIAVTANDLQVPSFSKILTALKYYQKYLSGDRYVLCFQPPIDPQTNQIIPTTTSQSLIISGKDKPLVIYGLALTTSSALAPLLSVSGTNITLQNLTLTGPGPAVVGSVGVKLSGSGHQVLDSKIAGFATGVWADCAWPKDTVGSYGPSCTIGPTNTIGDSTDATGKKLVQIGVHVPSTGQQVTVTQSSITTTADIAAAPDSIADTKRIVLDPGANGDVKALAIVQEPLDKANIWQALSADQTLLSTLLGILPAQGTIDLFKEPINSYEGSGAIFMAHCGAIQKDQNHYPHLALTEGTWLFECKRLNWPYDVGTENIRLSLLYTQGGNSAPYAKAIIRREITPSIPAPLSTIPDTIGGVAPEGPAIGGPGEIVSDGGSGVISSGGLGGGGEVVALGPTGPESSAPAPGPGDTTVPDDKSGTAATASGMTGSATSPVKACSLIRSPAPPLAGSAPSVLGLFLLLTLVVLGTCRIRHPRERSTPS